MFSKVNLIKWVKATKTHEGNSFVKIQNITKNNLSIFYSKHKELTKSDTE